MRTHSSLVVDVVELLESPGSRKPLHFTSDVPGLDAGLSHAAPELGFDLVAEAIEGGIWVNGTVSGRYSGECRRCLAAVEGPFSFPAAELYRQPAEVWE